MNSPAQLPYKSGIIAILGHPNVGKSTLLNALCGQKIAAVSPRPQTTRRRQLGILTLEQAQVIFVDTPGVHQPRHKLGEKMNQMALETLQDADLIFFIVDASHPPSSEDLILSDGIKLAGRDEATFLLLNKIDLLSPAHWEQRKLEFSALLPKATALVLSATRGEGKDELMQLMLDRLPEGPQYYPEDQITDLFERDLAADLIREATYWARKAGRACVERQDVLQALREASAEARSLMNRTRTPVLQKFGIKAALADFIDHISERPHAPEVTYRCEVEFRRLAPIIENAIFRVAQEAITNAFLHSTSELVRVSLVQDGEEVTLEVQDYGIGYDPANVATGRFGLDGMRERARSFGKELELDSRPGQGTRIRATFPVIQPDEQEMRTPGNLGTL